MYTGIPILSSFSFHGPGKSQVTEEVSLLSAATSSPANLAVGPMSGALQEDILAGNPLSHNGQVWPSREQEGGKTTVHPALACLH